LRQVDKLESGSGTPNLSMAVPPIGAST